VNNNNTIQRITTINKLELINLHVIIFTEQTSSPWLSFHFTTFILSCLVQAYGSFSDVEKYKMFGLVGDKCPEIAANDAMPSGAVLMVKKGLHT
jgi:hypothetical protein